MSFFDQLQQASLGGVPFGVLSGVGHFGRRNAVHEYPFRDTPWPEDMGRAARKIDLVGFLVENDAMFKGTDVITQREHLIAVAESASPSTLVHPTLGTLQVSLLELAIAEKWDEGRYFELSFGFIEAGQRIFPKAITATGDAVNTASDDADEAVSLDFVADVGILLSISEIIGEAMATAASWASSALSVVQDATNIIGMVAGMATDAINYGLSFGGALTGFIATAQSVVTAAVSTVAEVISAANAVQAMVTSAIADLETAVASALPIDIAAAAQTLSGVILATMVDPADAIRLMPTLAEFEPGTYTGPPSIMANKQAVVQVAMGNLFRRCAVIALARASATYQPSSSNDAVTVRNTVLTLLDNEIEIAGDMGDDTTFSALRTLRQAVVTDMNSRGAALPSLKTCTLYASLPAPVVALRLYRDAGRADEIARETGAPHPAFQPLNFVALSR